jgi:hypothetical protein
VVKFSCGNVEAGTVDRAKDVVVDDAECLPHFWNARRLIGSEQGPQETCLELGVEEWRP